MPAPACRAPDTPRIAAPWYCSDPVSIITTPRAYLSDVAVGAGHQRATSGGSACLREPLGASTPMSTTCTVPQRDAAGSITWQGFTVANVTVWAALKLGWTAPESASSPLGRSTDSTGTPRSAQAAASVATGSGRPGREPRPVTASMTRTHSARASTASTAPTCRQPAASAASRPPRHAPRPARPRPEPGGRRPGSRRRRGRRRRCCPGRRPPAPGPSSATAAATRATSAAARPIRSTPGSASNTSRSAPRASRRR